MGFSTERHVAERLAIVRRDIFRVYRLHAPSHASEQHHAQPVLYVLTHDSIGLGEDGPTHQRLSTWPLPRDSRTYVYRPGDANEVIECYAQSYSRIAILRPWCSLDKIARRSIAVSSLPPAAH